MKLWLHHINRVSDNVEHLRRFYSDVMGLGEHTKDLPLCEPTRDYTGDVAFRTDDIKAFKKHLEANGVPYSNYAGVATGGGDRIFPTIRREM